MSRSIIDQDRYNYVSKKRWIHPSDLDAELTCRTETTAYYLPTSGSAIAHKATSKTLTGNPSKATSGFLSPSSSSI